MFSNPSSTVCYSLNSYSSDPHGQLMINDNQLFFLVLNVSNKSLVYVKATLGQGLTDWMKTMSCYPNSDN